MQSLHSVFFFSFTFLTNMQNDTFWIKVLIWYNLFNLNFHMIDMRWCTQHCDTVRGLEGGVPAFFSILGFLGGTYFFWFNYALYNQLQVVHTFVQHCTTLFFYNKQLYNVQPNICIIHIFIGIEACVTII